MIRLYSNVILYTLGFMGSRLILTRYMITFVECSMRKPAFAMIKQQQQEQEQQQIQVQEPQHCINAAW